MKILVAGAGGYIGARLATFLSDVGYEVIAVCNKNVPRDTVWLQKMHKVLVCDLSNYDDVSKLKKYECEVIINLVSLDHKLSEGKPDYVNKVNVIPTWNFMDVFSTSSLRKYIYFSTIHVYGSNLSGLIDETNIPKPFNRYGLTHLFSEQVASYFGQHSDIDCYNVRLSNGYGPPEIPNENCWNLAINNLCWNAWKKKAIILNSDGSAYRDFINLKDILIGVVEIIKCKSGTSNTINFSSGHSISILQAAMLVKRIYSLKFATDLNIYVNHDQLIETISSGDQPEYSLVNEKYITLTKNHKMVSLEEGIGEVFDYLSAVQ